MTFVKGAVFLLLLAAVGINADNDDCDGLNKTMPGSDLHKLSGDWVLVWSSSDSTIVSVENITNSHLHFHPSADNSSMVYIERNRFPDGSCATHNATFSITSDRHTLDLVDMFELKDGVGTAVNQSTTVKFYQTCNDCVTMVWDGKVGRFLLFYRREGHHHDHEKIAESHAEFQKLSGCLGIPVEKVFIHKGAEDFCHKTPATKDVIEASEA